jgi:hypothetical protein
MSSYQRGAVKKITLHIEYPDGSTKTLEVKDPEKIDKLVFDSAEVPDEHRQKFDVSTDDWKANPAVVAIYNGGDVIPFCTHNGCK